MQHVYSTKKSINGFCRSFNGYISRDLPFIHAGLEVAIQRTFAGHIQRHADEAFSSAFGNPRVIGAEFEDQTNLTSPNYMKTQMLKQKC